LDDLETEAVGRRKSADLLRFFMKTSLPRLSRSLLNSGSEMPFLLVGLGSLTMRAKFGQQSEKAEKTESLPCLATKSCFSDLTVTICAKANAMALFCSDVFGLIILPCICMVWVGLMLDD
jgi:hypothetical protein